MINQLSLAEFLEASKNQIILDVRTPLEYEQGHIIDALNLPLFTNEERVLVGTCYKQEGRQPAILLGFELIGGRWANYIRQVSDLLKANSTTTNKSNKVFVHCWRGGMRSGAMAWALSMYGFDVYVLKGGYKVCRKYYLEALDKEYPIIILSGKTGSAKTDTLLAMKNKGEQVIDLEGMVNHQGSSFGSKGDEYQPSQEQFENCLAHELMQLDIRKRIWFENESIVIGKRVIPPHIFKQMRVAKIIDLKLPLTERLHFLDQDYGTLNPDFLKESVLKISKRLGPNETKITLQAIDENRMKDFIAQVLVYYDKTYQRSQEKRDPSSIYVLALDKIAPEKNAETIIGFCNEMIGNDVSKLMNQVENEINDTKF